jgi:hypothetical protein
MNALDMSTVFRDTATEVLRSGYRLRFRAGGRAWGWRSCLEKRSRSKPPTVGELKLKDIILYRTGRGIIGHRAVRIANLNGASVLLVRGDAEQGSGEPVGADQILGTLVAVGRDGRCIDLASRKTKVKQAISIHASHCKQQIRLLLIAWRANWRSDFGPIGRSAAG